MRKYIATTSILLPSLALAQSFDLAGSTIGGVLKYITQLISVLNPILFSGAFIVFFWGLSKFILNSDSKDEIEKGKNYMIWGILVLFILVSFKAIINFIASDLDLGNANSIIRLHKAN